METHHRNDGPPDVTPLESGEKKLYLTVTARLFLSNGEVQQKDVAVKEAVILVEVDHLWITKRFVTGNWQYVFGSPIVIGLLYWLGRKIHRKRNRRPAGFER